MVAARHCRRPALHGRLSGRRGRPVVATARVPATAGCRAPAPAVLVAPRIALVLVAAVPATLSGGPVCNGKKDPIYEYYMTDQSVPSLYANVCNAPHVETFSDWVLRARENLIVDMQASISGFGNI